MSTPDRLNLALLALHDRVVEVGVLPPCATDSNPDRWTDDDPDKRARAAVVCRYCPVLAECHAVAMATPRSRRWGVWGGRDWTGAETST